MKKNSPFMHISHRGTTSYVKKTSDQTHTIPFGLDSSMFMLLLNCLVEIILTTLNSKKERYR